MVFGDIGTSPLYTVKVIFAPWTGIALDKTNLIGVVSSIIWALMLVVTLKYVLLILRADNRGEGGGLALTALAANAVRNKPGLRNSLLLLGIFGATLFYGDSVITPAISVLGAMEGLEVIAPDLGQYIPLIAVSVLLLLFLAQRKGTHTVGKFFGPIMLVWFSVLSITGVLQIIQEPTILMALNPLYAVHFLVERGPYVLAVVGAIVLALTGAEALYADMGHFGRKPIQLTWLGLVFPALALNYMGQGALLLRDPAALENPFYHMFPAYLLIPAVLLSSAAAVIASQAVISGAYSLTKQAILLGFLPRMHIVHTSELNLGQIYLPAVNWILLTAVIITVFIFQSSSALAGAYGIAVTLEMVITSIMAFFVIRYAWKMPLALAVMASGFLVVIDLFLFAGCVIKFFDGGWFPIVMGLSIFGVMTTWASGRKLLVESIQKDGIDLVPFITQLDFSTVNIAERTAIYAVANPKVVPQALLHNMKHNQVLHRKNIILTVQFEEIPRIPLEQCVEISRLSDHFWRVIVKRGFMDNTDIPLILENCKQHGLDITAFESTYFLSRETVVPTQKKGMMHWREKLFATMSRNSSDIAGFFQLPDNAVVELGTRVQI